MDWWYWSGTSWNKGIEAFILQAIPPAPMIDRWREGMAGWRSRPWTSHAGTERLKELCWQARRGTGSSTLQRQSGGSWGIARKSCLFTLQKHSRKEAERGRVVNWRSCIYVCVWCSFVNSLLRSPGYGLYKCWLMSKLLKPFFDIEKEKSNSCNKDAVLEKWRCTDRV